MPALALLMVPQRHAHWITCSPTALSCGRSKYSIPFQLDCVPRNVCQSNSTSSPSVRKKPSSSATKSLRPIPFGATLIFMERDYIAWISNLAILELLLRQQRNAKQDFHRNGTVVDFRGPERPFRQRGEH